MKLLQSVLNVFNMFGISIWYDKNNEPYSIGIICKIFYKVIGYQLGKKPLNKFITCFVKKFYFRMLVYLGSNKEIKFYVQEHLPSWIFDGPWYNPTICSQFNGC